MGKSKSARVDQIPRRDADSVRSVELASIAENASEFSLKINEDEDTMINGNTGAVVGIKDKGGDDVGRHEHLLRSGPMGKCSDPFCTTCPSYFGYSKQPVRSSSDELIRKARRYGSRAVSWGRAWMPGILNPHTKLVNQWNKIFCISSLVAIFVDPLFFFLLSVRQEDYCLVFNNSTAVAFTVIRTLTDTIHVCYIVVQFRLAYVIHDSNVLRAGELEDKSKKIALHYLKGWFILDLCTALPLPQFLIWTVVKNMLDRPSGANYAKNVLRVVVFVQNIPRSIRVFALLLGWTPSGFVFETSWSNFVINLFLYLLAGHIVGACWYLFGLQRVNVCLQSTCDQEIGLNSTNGLVNCTRDYLDCGGGETNVSFRFRNDPNYASWKNVTSVGNFCLVSPSPQFNYGIYVNVVPVILETRTIDKYIYSGFWGFQQISTLAGNENPSTFVWEVLFTWGISALGLFLLAGLIGNMQNFLQTRGQRKMEIVHRKMVMQLERYDTEAWMRQQRLPKLLRKRVREAGRFKWAATGGVRAQELIDDLPEDLQEDIQRFLYMDLVKKVRLFELLEDRVLHAICERLSQKLYIENSEIFRLKKPVERMLFIVRGRLESRGEDGEIVHLQEGDFCGEELLSWYIDKTGISTEKKSKHHRGQHPLSSRTVKCLTSVEAVSLESDGLEYVTTYYKAAFKSPRVQGVMRYLSLHWRSLACRRIQKAWRASKERRSQGGSTSSWPSVGDPRITRFGSMKRMNKRTNESREVQIINHAM